jgi:hypothetical protein
MATRIYIATVDGKRRLVRANTPAAVRNHIAKDIIAVEVASPDDTYALGTQGVRVEELVAGPVQTEIVEAA